MALGGHSIISRPPILIFYDCLWSILPTLLYHSWIWPFPTFFLMFSPQVSTQLFICSSNKSAPNPYQGHTQYGSSLSVPH